MANASLQSGNVGEFTQAAPPDAPSRAEPDVEAAPWPTTPEWVRYDDELELVCRVAAQIGGTQPAPVSYTALFIALMWVEGPASEWLLASVVGTESQTLILSSKGVDDGMRESTLEAARDAAVPEANPLYSRSSRNLFDQATRIARDVARRPGPIVLGTRHLLAAYVFRNPSDHVDQVRGWGIDADEWRERFVDEFAPRHLERDDEDWARVVAPAAAPSAPVIGSFTADDPLAPREDLLEIDDEASAFARLAAARDVSPPLAIGVFGEWGSGKTFFMRRVQDGVQALSAAAAARRDAGHAPGPFLSDIVQIRFNAWHYIETNLWASLVEFIFTELDRWLRDKTRDGRADAEQVFDRLATAQQLKLDALDAVISRRAERRGAQLRAERARREYEEAQVRAAGVGAGTYARALMDTILERQDVRRSVHDMADALGAPQLADSSARVLDVLEQARSEAGRARLQVRAGVARLGSARWIAAIAAALLVAPLLAVAARDTLAAWLQWDGLKQVHETVLALSGALTALAAWGGALVRRASSALDHVDAFDKRLQELSAKGASRPGSTAAARQQAAEEDLRKRKQALEAAERALADAEARLNEARSDFEGASARSRLNAFIRAKVTDGDYAKHLGIIAAIRRDFGQLAALMDAVQDADEQQAESERLAAEMYAGVLRFLQRVSAEPDVRLTVAEVRSLLTLLDAAHLEMLLADAAGHRRTLASWLDGAQALDAIVAELKTQHAKKLPQFSRIVLYIDDLDRCPPSVVVDVLQAVHLLLCFPLFIVVVAVDARWISRALHQRYPKLLDETGLFAAAGPVRRNAAASSHDYLEKIFQIPYWVRPIDAGGAQRYVSTLVERDVRRIAVGAAALDAAAAGSGAARAADAPAAFKARTAGAASRGVATPGDGSAVLPPDAVGLELTRWEADALERFAPLIGATPRRLIRFVNLYRLIKTGLAGDARQRLLGSPGESAVSRALVVQLAIITGAPNAAPAYFRALAQRADVDDLVAVGGALADDASFVRLNDHTVVLQVLQSAHEWPGEPLSVGELRVTAATARRYSFTAWGA